uniref:hypothetical protein n=1 Tax=Paraisaria gracilis TaxID=2651840 RepID=UPI001EAA6931|nr:hypothetical protein M9553_mgp03 [Paraisaria gracilis]UDN38739.1 hypothetical protein [Paraisaria gracilis]
MKLRMLANFFVPSYGSFGSFGSYGGEAQKKNRQHCFIPYPSVGRREQARKKEKQVFIYKRSNTVSIKISRKTSRRYTYIFGCWTNRRISSNFICMEIGNLYSLRVTFNCIKRVYFSYNISFNCVNFFIDRRIIVILKIVWKTFTRYFQVLASGFHCRELFGYTRSFISYFYL